MSLIQGRTKRKKNSTSGIKKIWLMSYNRYARSQITQTGEQLISFPLNTIYKYDLEDGATISERFEDNEDGGFYNQTIQVKLIKLDSDANHQLNILNKRLVRLIKILAVLL